MNFLIMILVGFLAGSLAKYIVPGDEGGGFILTTLLGIGGGLVGGWLFGLLGLSINGLLGSIIGATAGAALLIFGYNKLKGKSA